MLASKTEYGKGLCNMHIILACGGNEGNEMQDVPTSSYHGSSAVPSHPAAKWRRNGNMEQIHISSEMELKLVSTRIGEAHPEPSSDSPAVPAERYI